MNYKLVPRSKHSWVGKKYEDAILVGFSRDGHLILLTQIKGKPRSTSKSSWTSNYWKIPFNPKGDE